MESLAVLSGLASWLRLLEGAIWKEQRQRWCGVKVCECICGTGHRECIWNFDLHFNVYQISFTTEKVQNYEMNSNCPVDISQLLSSASQWIHYGTMTPWMMKPIWRGYSTMSLSYPNWSSCCHFWTSSLSTAENNDGPSMWWHFILFY